MSEPDGKPPEKKLSPWKQFLEDLSWDIPFVRAFGNLLLGIFFEEGKAVKSGWLAFIIFTGIAFWGGCHYSERNIDAKLSSITNYFGGVLAKKDSDISELKGELADARADRDKNQLMLAPFEAMAISKYTNAPMEQRLDMLVSGMVVITNAINELATERPNLALMVNGVTLPCVDNAQGAMVALAPVTIKKSEAIILDIACLSKVAAQGITIDFFCQIDPTNLATDGWHPQPSDDWGRNHWSITSDHLTPQHGLFRANPLIISSSFRPASIAALIIFTADNTITYESAVLFNIQ